jgi:hypothetical protein
VRTRTAHRWGPRTCYLCSCLQRTANTGTDLQQKWHYHAVSLVIHPPIALQHPLPVSRDCYRGGSTVTVSITRHAYCEPCLDRRQQSVGFVALAPVVTSSVLWHM